MISSVTGIIHKSWLLSNDVMEVQNVQRTSYQKASSAVKKRTALDIIMEMIAWTSLMIIPASKLGQKKLNFAQAK
jgi:hypothetical protein